MRRWINPLTAVCWIVLVIWCVCAKKKCHIDRQRKWVDCSHRGLSKIPNSTFPLDARAITMSWNRVRRVKDCTFHGFSHLTSLDLSNNRLIRLEPLAFEGLQNLEFLNLGVNPIKLVPKIFSPTLFRPLARLSTLYLQMYDVTDPDGWRGIDRGFSMLSNLTELFMDFPFQFNFDDGFANLTRLRTISTSGLHHGCILESLRNETFKVFVNTSLRELRLINCTIAYIEAGSFLPLRKLKVLDLSANDHLGLSRAVRSLYGLQQRDMEEINFSKTNNFLIPSTSMPFFLSSSDMVYLKNICVRCIDFSNNFLFDLFDEMAGGYFGQPDCLQFLSISQNNMYFVTYITSQLSTYPHLVYADLSGTCELSLHQIGQESEVSVCRTRQDSQSVNVIRTGRGTDLDTIHTNAFHLTLIARNCLLWVDLDFATIENITNLKTLDISYNNIDQCQLSIGNIETVTDLQLSGLLCSQLDDLLTHFPKTERLNISNSPNLYLGLADVKVTGDNFQSLTDLQQIDLSGNKLADLNTDLFDFNSNLRLINLSNNKLQRIPIAILRLENVSQLDLSLNAFAHLTAKEMSLLDHFAAAQYNRSHFSLSMRLNPLQCTCETLDFIRWIYTVGFDLDLPGDSQCVLSNGSRVSLAGFQRHLKDVSVSCVSHTWIVVGVVGGLLVLLIILLSYGLYRYRINLRYWLYSKLQPPMEMLVQREYVYDAFVAYCEEDYHWIYNDVRNALENDNERGGLKLCMHNRDFTPGKPIHENIVDKMRQSRKIVLSISPEFLNSTYGPLEIEYAGMKSMEEGREDIVICVLLQEIPVRGMPKALRNLWHKITFLKWPEDAREHLRFWKQLRDAITDA